MAKRFKSWFFGPSGSLYNKFSTGNVPNQQTFQELINSATFTTEVSDTANTSTQGLVKLDTDSDVLTRVVPTVGDFSKVTRGYQLPEVITANVAGDTDDANKTSTDPGYSPSTVLNGRGFRITYLKRTIGSLFRRVFKLENTLIFHSSDTTLDISEDTIGTIVMKLKLQSTGRTITINPIAGGYNLETIPGVGPSGINSIAVMKSNDALVPCDSDGTPSSYPTVLLSLYDGTTHVDMSGFDLTDANIFNPTVSNCAARYSHSGYDVLVTFTGATDNTGSIIAEIKYNGSWYSTIIEMVKVKNGTNGLPFVYKGELTTPPGDATFYWWYHNTNTGIAYFYDTDSTWKVLLKDGISRPVEYHTLTNAGLVIGLTSADKHTQVIHVSGAITLAAPIIITAVGSFPDGFTFNVILDAGFNKNGEGVNILGESIDVNNCLIPFSAEYVYSLTAGAWTKKGVQIDHKNVVHPLTYKAYLSQTGTNDPVATEIYNTIGAIAWTRTGVGTYTGVLGGMFPIAKTFILGSHISESGTGVIDGLVSRGRSDDNTISVNTFDFSTHNPSDAILNHNEILIEVYP